MSSHPFNLSLPDLEDLDINFQDELTDDEAEQVGGGVFRCGTPPGTGATTRALGEEGGYWGPAIDMPPVGGGKPEQPPQATTLAIGEEGGDVMTTMALGEEGGSL
jgi:hypothetical protein